jgi:hypothetical protein
VKSYRGPPMTLGNAAGAKVRLIVWCKSCQHRMELDPVEMAARYGAKTPVLDWREKLVCSKCGGRQVDMVVTGTKRRGGASVRSGWKAVKRAAQMSFKRKSGLFEHPIRRRIAREPVQGKRAMTVADYHSESFGHQTTPPEIRV